MMHHLLYDTSLLIEIKHQGGSGDVNKNYKILRAKTTRKELAPVIVNYLEVIVNYLEVIY